MKKCDHAAALRDTIAFAKALLFPRQCPYCGRVIGFTECDRCEEDLKKRERRNRRLSAANHYLERLDGASAVYFYDGRPRAAVLNIKYNGAAWNAGELGVCMAEKLFGCSSEKYFGALRTTKGSALLHGWDYVVPVPPSNTVRGFNVPTLLANEIASGLAVPMLEHALYRKVIGKRQVTLGREERLANAAGAFAVNEAAKTALEGKRILLVDDVITTGATVTACAQALLDSGAESVFAVAFCVSE